MPSKEVATVELFPKPEMNRRHENPVENGNNQTGNGKSQLTQRFVSHLPLPRMKLLNQAIRFEVDLNSATMFYDRHSLLCFSPGKYRFQMSSVWKALRQTP